jgi:hypothetical protein
MLPENIRPFSHEIKAGKQIEIPGDPDQLRHIIDQHSIYGLQPADKIGKGFGGMCYRLDKPISVEAIHSGFSQTEQDAIDQALEARKNTAAAADQMIANRAQEMGIRQKSGLELEIIEEKKNAGDNDQKFTQTIEVVREGTEPIRGRGRPRKTA